MRALIKTRAWLAALTQGSVALVACVGLWACTTTTTPPAAAASSADTAGPDGAGPDPTDGSAAGGDGESTAGVSQADTDSAVATDAAGAPTSDATDLPAPATNGWAIQVASAVWHSCAVSKDHRVACWGSNDRGQLGDGTTESHLTPQFVSGPTNVVTVQVSNLASCAATATGTLWCWGTWMPSNYGSLTALTPFAVNIPKDTTTVVVTGSHVRTVGAGGQSGWVTFGQGNPVSGIYSPGGTLKAMGCNTWTACATIDVNGFAACEVPGAVAVADVVALADTTALTAGGDVYDLSQAKPKLVAKVKPPKLPVQLATYGLVDADGQLTVWQEAPGMVSGDDFAQLSEPVTVTVLPKLASLAASRPCAVDVAGGVWCWGDNDGGRTGDGFSGSSKVPVAVQGIQKAKQIAVATDRVCAVEAVGGVKCWGVLAYGDHEPVPGYGHRRQVATLVPGFAATTLAVGLGGESALFAVDASGLVTGLGFDYYLEKAGWGPSPGPSPIAQLGSCLGLGMARSVGGGCTIGQDHLLRCWGSIGGGIAAIGGQSYVAQGAWPPLLAPGFGPVVKVAVGQHVACALRQNGTVRCVADKVNPLALPCDVTTCTYEAQDLPAVATVADVAVDDQDVVVATAGGQVLVRHTVGWTAGKVDPVPLPEAATAVATTINGQRCALGVSGKVYCWRMNFADEPGKESGFYESAPVAMAGLSDAIAIAADYDTLCALRAGGQVMCWGAGAAGILGNGHGWRTVPWLVAAPPP